MKPEEEYGLTEEEWKMIFDHWDTSKETDDKIFRHETEILSCPFCGSTVAAHYDPETGDYVEGISITAIPARHEDGYRHILYTIECPCGAKMGADYPYEGYYADDLENCIQAWNSRAAGSRKKITETVWRVTFGIGG